MTPLLDQGKNDDPPQVEYEFHAFQSMMNCLYTQKI